MRKTTKIGGFLVGVGAGVAAVIWMIRERIMKPETVPVTPEDAPAFRVAPAPVPRRDDADDLSEIKGIGPVYKARLAAAGISRFDELAATPVARLAEVAEVAESRAEEWVDQARALVG